MLRSLDNDDMHAIGRYQLLARIGHGGMGEVFEAWDPQLERRVALKLLLARDDDGLALREARCLARVAHPNVVAVHEVDRRERLPAGATPKAVVYIAMEFVDGSDLRRWLGAGPRRWTDVLDGLIAAGRGLAAVHRAGLVHGDVKPGNVLVGRDGRVRLADFGLARVRARAVEPELAASVRRVVAAEIAAFAELGETRTAGLGEAVEFQPSRAAGTVAYMAPECLSGERAPQPQADQYSLCAMAWEALFGVRPFTGRGAAELLTAVAMGRLEPGTRPRGMPGAVARVLRRGLSERPERRWQSVDALVEALAEARRPPRWLGRSLSAGVVGVAILTTTMGGFGRAAAIAPPPAMSQAPTGGAVSSAPAAIERQAETALAVALASERSLDEAVAGLGAALRELERGDRWMPRLNGEQREQRAEMRVELLLARARVHGLVGREAAALEDAQAALAIASTSPRRVALVAEARLTVAVAEFRRGQCERALAAMTAIDSTALRRGARALVARKLDALEAPLFGSQACAQAHQDLVALAGWTRSWTQWRVAALGRVATDRVAFQWR